MTITISSLSSLYKQKQKKYINVRFRRIATQTTKNRALLFSESNKNIKVACCKKSRNDIGIK